jgi:hypothetical protein
LSKAQACLILWRPAWDWLPGPYLNIQLHKEFCHIGWFYCPKALYIHKELWACSIKH